MGDCRVHNVRFYNIEPKAIHCMSYEPNHRKLALSRFDSSVEIWNLRNISFLQKVIPGSPQGSVEALAWCHDRLFSTGINARVVEYNLNTLMEKYSVSVTAGPAWCLGVNKKRTCVAVGTEDGYINIFSLTCDSLQYEKILDKQEGRILCLSWDSTGDYIVTGSVDAVRIWNVHAGHAVHKMTTGRSEAKKETIVWCIAVTDDFTVISGDSRGKICFWNGHTGINTETYQSHEADVLCLALSEDQSTVYCSGVDPLIATFTRITMRSSSLQNSVVGSSKCAPQRSQWCRSANRRIHEHDVRAMAICHDKLCSAGVDSYLAISRPPKVLVKYPPIPQAPCVVVCPKSRCVLLKYTSHLEVWRLGDSEKLQKSTVENGFRNRQRRHSGDGTVGKSIAPPAKHVTLPSSSEPLQLVKNPIKILELKSRNEEHIVCSALSNNARWLAYSTESLIRIYSLSDVAENKPRLEKVSPLPQECSPSHRLKFTSDSSRLVVVSQEGQLLLFTLNLKESSVNFSYALNATNLLKDAVHLLEISSNNQFVVAADHQSNIIVWRGKEHYCSLPRYTCEPSALAISPCSCFVVVVYVDSKIVEYSLEDKKYTAFSRSLDNQHPKQWLSRSFPVINVTYDPRNSEIIILHDDNTICIVDKRKKLAPAEAKIPRLDPPLKTDSAEEKAHPGTDRPVHAFHVIKRYKHLVYFGWLAGDEVVAVEVNPMRLLRQLPPTLYKKRFGM